MACASKYTPSSVEASFSAASDRRSAGRAFPFESSILHRYTRCMAAAKWKTAAVAVAIAGAGIVAIALISGVLYEQTQRARDRERYPQIGRSVDIGGRTLNIDCAGAGQPAVILESG